MMKHASMSGIGRIVLLFWAAWLTVVATTNVLDALAAIGALPDSFKFISGNWAWINQVMDPLAVPRVLQAVLFAGAIGWEVLGAVLFWRAVGQYRGGPLEQEPAALTACAVNLALWAAFQVLDEVFRAYDPERVHRAIFVGQITTIVLLQVLPRSGSPARQLEGRDTD